VSTHGAAAGGGLLALRDDGPLSARIGGLVRGQLPPLLPVVAGVMVTAMLVTLGLHNLPGVLILTPAAALLLAALGAGHPHDGRLDWLVPPLLQAAQYVYLAAVGFAARVPPAATFALIAVVVLHHLDVAHRQRSGIPGMPRVSELGLGWEGRMLAAGFAAMLGIGAFGYIALAAYLAAVFGWDGLTCWFDTSRGG
jgi:hypothetical protein